MNKDTSFTTRLKPAALSLLLAVTLANTALAEGEIKPFSVVYNVKYSIAKGNMTLNVSANETGGYNIDSKTVAEGAAKLVAGKPIREHAEFEINDGVVRSLSYELDDGTDGGEEDMKIAYDWEAGKVTMTSAESGEVTKALEPDMMDQLVMQAAAIKNVAEGVETFTLRALRPDKDYQTIIYTRMGEETLKTKIGELNTIKYSRKREGSSRENHFWYAIDYEYVPVQLEQVKGSKSVWKATLEKLDQ